ncbi:QWRF motif-containing protein 3-like [Rutidosis leptorrhynchoides]|uniref:QWRF motif-containing protein 3-like n=1 Tax=Rutidosis leptorrhynchoides TaxID=125765 RepID=UPI003A990EB7
MNNNNILKEYHTPVYSKSGSIRYNGRSSISSSTSSSSDVYESNHVILPGRLSVDENVLRRTSYNSESSDLGSPFMTGINSYMHVAIKKFMSMKRENSSLDCDSSPSRFGSPLFSILKPPSVKKNLLHIGLDLIKGKKGGSKLCSFNSDMITNMENVHQLKLLQNSLLKWRYANARAQVSHDNLATQCVHDLINASLSTAKLRQSVVQKKLQLQKEKLEMKLNLVLHSQMKILEAWGENESRHNVDISIMKYSLHAVVCMIPLIEGAKACDMLSELADVVITQEKLLLEECFEHLKIISTIQMQEKSLRCCIMTLDSVKEQKQQGKELFFYSSSVGDTGDTIKVALRK